MEDLQLTPTRPYMIRAFYEWLEDNSLTPYLLVDATQDNLVIPTEHVQNGQIVLNIASRATGNMSIDNSYINFNARFGGVSKELWIPMQAVIAIFAKENQSIAMPFDPSEYDHFNPEESEQPSTTKAEDSSKTKKTKRENKPGLRVLK
ncbi:ClpXP protease specificity-enhancing factor [Psychrobacter sp. FDAARGOS_221]|uniref:ClpXP protease specificity-enhancing factor n=1 Tax=Psychrobacter sp. FDAARGOS_221 TaxID=1975705 RepID=UPI000BB546E9|nr:ClpXP protease specificity-enhancing factor [Psychrobacter sp. FDAARGOS_221]PNK61561.1 ClpXP protease specificity-enhancing factor [Psychrobacter sp. FDAARGOS_221]